MAVGKKIKAYLDFTKFRLSSLVILSALSGYLFMDGPNDWFQILCLMVGGTLVTGASNGANQIWEKDFDKLMKRTQNRPIPTNLMSVKESYIVVIVTLVVGSICLLQLNWYSMLLGLFAFFVYVFIYTPMKRVSPWAVFVGAFPGAIPPMLGAIAKSGEFGIEPGILFFVQFVWQFPHFWAIAWVQFEDYKTGGYSLLPSKGGKNKASAFIIMLYSLFLIAFTLMPWVLDLTNMWSLIIGGAMSFVFFLTAYRLYTSLEDKDARTVMFTSFIFLPVVQFLYVFTKI